MSQLESELREIIKGLEEIRLTPSAENIDINDILNSLNDALRTLYEFADLREATNVDNKTSYYTKIKRMPGSP